jgi:RNA polymerase subunit RPABC4/transcription elongation factor Spt4
LEETFARTIQFIVASIAAFSVALWFALAVWTYRDIGQRTGNIAVQIVSTLVVVLGFLPGIVIYLLLRPRETLEQRYQREIEETYLAQELSGLPSCPRCARSVRDEFIFCPDCGTVLRRTCGNCGRLADVDWEICAFCGSDLPARVALEGNGNGRIRERSERYSHTDDWEVDLDLTDGSDAPRPATQEQGRTGILRRSSRNDT